MGEYSVMTCCSTPARAGFMRVQKRPPGSVTIPSIATVFIWEGIFDPDATGT